MSRRLDWDRVRKPRIVSWVPEVTDELPGVQTQREAKRAYLNAAVSAATRGRPLPEPSSAFLRYFRAEFPNGSVEEWLKTEPEYRAEVSRRIRAKSLNRERYLAKLADIEGAFREPPLPPTSLGEVDEPVTPEKIWTWARQQPEYSKLLKQASSKKGPFN